MKKTLMLCVFLVTFSGCNEDRIKSVKIAPEKKISREKDSSRSEKIAFDEYVLKQFSNTYKETIIGFEDGSTYDISKPLIFEEPSNDLAPLFIELNIEEPFEISALDENGVITQDGKYHPTTIGRTALDAIGRYNKTKSKAAKKVFLDQMSWIVANFYETDNYGFWYFSEAAALYNLDPGWPSVLSQGLLLDSCLEAYILTKEVKYVNIVEKALKGYMVPIENGGFMRPWRGNELWFEEYPTKKPSRVLNGTMYGLIGVYNVAEKLKSPFAKSIFDAGINTVINHLDDYDAKYTSRYSLADWKNEIALEHYHEGHVIQLAFFYTITKNIIFKEYARKFLESDRGDFLTSLHYQIIKPKIKTIEASYCIDCETYGTKNLMNGFWAFGNFWSSHRKAELVFDFGEAKTDFKAVTLFHVSEQSKNVNFDLYAYNETSNTWEYVQQFITKNIKDGVMGYNKTRDFETFISHYKIFEEVNASKVKLVFNANDKSIIALREVDFTYDRTKELDYLLNKMEKWAREN